ncbi:MAG TPA: DUF1064 domain-containing protein [Phenylobacterium sp.]
MKRALKYRNKRTEVDGVVFDSRKESARYGELVLLQRAGEIRDLKRQVPFRMEVNGKLVCTYRADATYIETKTGELIVEDVKSPITRKDPLYRLKAKLLLAVHNIEIREI